MFGNRLGWGISVPLAALMLLIVYAVGRLDTPTGPSQGAINRKGTYSLKLLERRQMLDAIQLPFDPATVLPGMTQAQDSGPLYRQALAEYAKDVYQYDTRSKFKTTELDAFPALKPLIEATNYKAMNLFAAKPEEVINYQSIEPAAVKAIGQLGDAATTLSLMLKGEQKNAEALRLAEAAVSLGVKLCQERLRWFEFITGHQLITKGCLMIEQLDPSRAAPAKAAREAMNQLMKDRGLPLAYAITSIDPDVMGRTAGDVFYIVKNSRERMWRIEAVLKLGHYKWNAGEPGNAADQRWAKRLAKQLMNDPSEDPLVRAAAKEAFELTKDRYLMIGGT